MVFWCHPMMRPRWRNDCAGCSRRRAGRAPWVRWVKRSPVSFFPRKYFYTVIKRFFDKHAAAACRGAMRLLIFNLATDIDDPILGFTTHWIGALARRVECIHVITVRAGRLDGTDNVRVHSVGKEKGYREARRVVEFYRILWRLLRHERIDACFSH